ncbi:MAG TPA: FkbM family methyltransferase [Candidatus Paceibacterota bacterium]|nr:FkbM family methyltransferase [Candidatus Paceibacterota bacterium]
MKEETQHGSQKPARGTLGTLLGFVPAKVQGIAYKSARKIPGVGAAIDALLRSQIPETIPVGPYRLSLDQSDAVVSGSLALGVYEPGTVRVWRDLVRDATGLTVLDIGANVGYFTMLAVAENPAVRVIAFEPEPNAHAHFERSVLANALADRVTLLSSAAGVEPGQAELHLHPSNKGRHSLVAGSDYTSAITVRIERVDDALKPLGSPKVHAIKIDVEGFEPEAIAGASELIARDHPAILFEMVPERLRARGSDPEALLARLWKESYTLALIDEDTGALTELPEESPADAIRTIEHAGVYANVLAR